MDEKFTSLLRTAFQDDSSPELNGAEKCMAIGPGAGLREITFIKCVVPNLRLFAAIEPDQDSASRLQTNLQLHLPDVESIIYEKTVQQFFTEAARGQQTYDVILMIHVLYYITVEDRRLWLRLIEKILDSTLRSGGLVVIEYLIGSDGPDSFVRILDGLAPNRSIPYAVVLKEEFLAAGFKLYRNLKYDSFFDFNNLDDNFIKFLSVLVSRPLSVEEIKTAVRRVWPDCKGYNSGAVLIFQKP
jgi:hypothetical protein